VDLGTVRLTKGRSVRGRVVDEVTGLPLGGARFQVESDGEEEGETLAQGFSAQDGTFELPALERRSFLLTVTQETYVPVHRKLGTGEEVLELRLKPRPPSVYRVPAQPEHAEGAE
jgi:hypothetical protein